MHIFLNSPVHVVAKVTNVKSRSLPIKFGKFQISNIT